MKSLAQTKYNLRRKYDLEKWVIDLLEYSMLPKALRPHRSYIMGKFDISEDVYYYWLRNPKFNQARREMTKQFYMDDIPDVLMALKNEALAGNERAAKLFIEYVEDWQNDPRSEDPDNKRTVNIKEAKEIIINLHQKFYGEEKKPTEIIEGEVEAE